ncbi:MAG: aminotransferase class IV [Alicyclobacillus sp.]|nr:aminotransferase class IV [Alicyclobacillus sp.]
MTVVAYYQGKFVDPDALHVPLDERGHQFGDGVYEVVRVYSGRPFLLEWHLERLERSLAAVAIKNPHTRAEWVSLINEAIRRHGEPESTVYWQVTRGIAPRAHTFPAVQPAVSLTVRSVQSHETSPGSNAVLCLPDERWANVFVKTINLLPNVIAKEVATRAGAVEALLVRNGRITEGASSNAWFVRDGVLYTAPANRYILPGITRRFVMHLANTLNIPVREQALTLDELDSVEEVFMTGTTTEILPIQRVVVDPARIPDLRGLSDTPPATLVVIPDKLDTIWAAQGKGAVTARLQGAFQDAIERFRQYESVVVEV